MSNEEKSPSGVNSEMVTLISANIIGEILAEKQIYRNFEDSQGPLNMTSNQKCVIGITIVKNPGEFQLPS